jgi:hypothetical protein
MRQGDVENLVPKGLQDLDQELDQISRLDLVVSKIVLVRVQERLEGLDLKAIPLYP